jgi:virulence-associated protein VapD
MVAIAFDLVVADMAQNYPKGVSQAHAEIVHALVGFGSYLLLRRTGSSHRIST